MKINSYTGYRNVWVCGDESVYGVHVSKAASGYVCAFLEVACVCDLCVGGGFMIVCDEHACGNVRMRIYGWVSIGQRKRERICVCARE